jgi:secreted protein with Ig-like and vWFA domain
VATRQYIRDDEAHISVKVNGVGYGNGDSWVTLAGGKLSAAGFKTRPGGMGHEVEVGGPATRSDVTVTTQADDIMAGQHSKLESLVGRGAAQIAVQFLYIDRTKRNAKFTIKGRLKEASLPDSNGLQPNVGMYSIVVSCDELAA